MARRRSVTINGKKVPVQEEKGGTGFTTFIQGDTNDEVMRIVESMQAYAVRNGLEQVEVISVQPSPAGGWEAMIRAHNFNVLKAASDIGKSAWEKTEGARGAAASAARSTKRASGTFAKNVAEKAKTKARGYSAAEWQTAESSLIMEGNQNPTEGDIRARIERFRREAKTRQEVDKYGIETSTPGKKVRLSEMVRNPQTGQLEPRVYEYEVPGKEFTAEEVQRRLKRAKTEAGPTFERKLADTARSAARATHEGFIAANIGLGRTAGQPFAPGAFRRGHTTFAPPSTTPSTIAAPSPGAQQRLMAATVMPGISPIGGLKPLSIGLGITPSVLTTRRFDG